ncbi:MAG: HAD-IIB family hydrolase [Desulfurococcales archaeon]|nr:HAD-IIB family hydrolase [Desulfurococcales archaeon]
MSSFLVYTDIDHTMLGRGGNARGISKTVRTYESLGVPVIPVTAKSITEIVAVREMLGLGSSGRLIAIAESGAAVYATEAILPYADGVKKVGDLLLEYVKLYPEEITLEEIDRAAQRAFNEAGCNPKPRDVSEMDPQELSAITGLPLNLARLIPVRDHMKIYFSRDRACKERVKEILESRGLYVGLGRNFIHVGAHRGKLYAANWLKTSTPYLSHRGVIAFGDSEPDRGLLEEADIPVVVPPEEGSPLRLARGDYMIAPGPPPEGWVSASEIIILNYII